MKPTFNLLLLFSALFFHAANGQSNDTASSSKQTSVVTSIQLSNRYSMVADFQTGSGSLNQYVLNRLLLGGYISPSEVDKAEKRLNTNTRAGLFTYLAFDAAYVFQPFPKVFEKSKKQFVFHGLGIGQQHLAGADFTSDLYRLVFQGNGNYAGKKLETGKIHMDQWNSRTLYFSGQRLFVGDSGISELSLNLGVSQLLAYRKLRISESWLYTDPNVQYVDAFVNGNYENSGKSSLSGNGFGLVASAQFVSKMRKFRSPVKLSIDNAGIYKVWSGNKVSVNNTEAVRLNQTNISYAELRNGFGIENQRDSILADLDADTVKLSKWVASPFRVAVEFNVRNVLNVSLDYTYISGYLPRVVLTPVSPFAFSFLSQVSIMPQLQLGGFDTYNLNLILGYDKIRIKQPTASRINFYVKLYGLEGFVLPKVEHGSGIMLTGAYYILKSKVKN